MKWRRSLKYNDKPISNVKISLKVEVGVEPMSVPWNSCENICSRKGEKKVVDDDDVSKISHHSLMLVTTQKSSNLANSHIIHLLTYQVSSRASLYLIFIYESVMIGQLSDKILPTVIGVQGQWCLWGDTTPERVRSPCKMPSCTTIPVLFLIVDPC